MKFNNSIFTILFFAVLLFSSCEKEFEEIEDTPEIPETEDLRVTNINGTIIDINDISVTNAEVDILSNGSIVASATTNGQGVFTFNNQEVPSSGTLLRVSKSNFITNYFRLVAKENRSNYVGLTLHPSNASVFFTPGNTVDYSENGVSFQLNPDDIELGSNGPWTVDVSYSEKENNLNSILNYNQGINQDENVLVDFTAFVALEIRDANGERVSIKSGKQIEVNLTPEMMVSESAWRLDETSGYWMPLQNVVSNNGTAVAFSSASPILGFGDDRRLSFLTGKVVDENDEPIAQARIEIDHRNSPMDQLAYSDNEGEFAISYFEGYTGMLSVNKESYQEYSSEMEFSNINSVGKIVLKSGFTAANNDSLKIKTELLGDSLSIVPWECQASFELPTIELVDGSITDFTVDWMSSAGMIAEGELREMSMEDSPVSVIVTVSTPDGEKYTQSFDLVIVDEVGPVPVCESTVVVQLTEEGSAKVFAEVFDQKSHDAGCDSELTFTACRVDVCSANPDGYSNFVEFTEDDVNKTVTVWVNVVDESGNYNSCQVEVDVKAYDPSVNSSPSCIESLSTAVVDPNKVVEIFARDFIRGESSYDDYTFELADKSECGENCEDGDFSVSKIFKAPEDLGLHTIIVRSISPSEEVTTCEVELRIKDSNDFGLTCEEEIVLSVWENCTAKVAVESFIQGDINWSIIESIDFKFRGETTVLTENNDMITFTLSNEKLEDYELIANFNEGEINSCWGQLTVQNKLPPVAICPQEAVVSLTEDNRAKVFAQSLDDGSYSNCDGELSFAVARQDECGGDCVEDDFGPFVEFDADDTDQYLNVILRVINESGNYSECMVSVLVQDKIGESDIFITCQDNLVLDCDYSDLNPDTNPDIDYPETNEGNLLNYTDDFFPFEDGGVKILRTWTALDPVSGYTTECHQTFRVEDRKAPTPYCQGNITLNIDDRNKAVLVADEWASDSFDNCSNKLTRKILRLDDCPDNCENISSAKDFIYFDSEDINKTIECRIFVMDESGNYDYCSTMVEVVKTTGGGTNVALACYDRLDIQLESNCKVNATLNEIVEGDLNSMAFIFYELKVGDESYFVSNPDREIDLTCHPAGDFIQYTVTGYLADQNDNNNGNSCWGNLGIDKSVQTNCPSDITINQGESIDPYVNQSLGVMTTNIDCMEVSYFDRIEYSDNSKGDVYRTWYVDFNGDGVQTETDTAEVDYQCVQVISIQ